MALFLLPKFEHIYISLISQYSHPPSRFLYLQFQEHICILPRLPWPGTRPKEKTGPKKPYFKRLFVLSVLLHRPLCLIEVRLYQHDLFLAGGCF